MSMIEAVNKINCRAEEAVGWGEKIGAVLFGFRVDEKNAEGVPQCVDEEIAQILGRLDKLNRMLCAISENIGA